MGNGLPHWNDGWHRDGGCQLGPWPLGLWGGHWAEEFQPFGERFLDHSWHTAIHTAQSKIPGSLRFQSVVGWWIWSCSEKCLPCCKKSHCQSAGSFLSSNPLSPFAPIWNPCWRLPGVSLTRLYGRAFPPSALNGGLLGSHFGGSLRLGQRLSSVWWVVLPLGLRWGPGHYWDRGRRSLLGRFPMEGDTPGGMISRVDVGAFPSSR